ncbi:MAG: response regulator [Chitinophagaceae bacterium]
METSLVVDDGEDFLAMLNHALNDNGYMVIALQGGGNARETIRAEKPALIIVNFSMGKWSGRDTCASIKEIPDFLIITIVIFSGLTEVESTGVSFRADVYVQKPVSANYLIKRLSSLMAA